MSDRIVLKAEVREEAGTKQSKKLREQGQLPVIIYGHKKEPVSAAVNSHDFVEILHHGGRIFDVNVKGKTETLLVKELQYDHLGKSVIHADLVRVDLQETVKVAVPLELKGTAAGTHEGGIIDEHLDSIEIECKVSEIPETILVSVKEVGVGDSIHAGDIELPTGTKLVTPADALIITCHLVAAAKGVEEGEGAEEAPEGPEVITERVAEEETEKES
ncbi:MAG: 50S ribosomal protein L25 [Sedimentisphaerales bacterium]|nr:50S ribosomal protein L25 [Sedimentisphaerales bacterium]